VSRRAELIGRTVHRCGHPSDHREYRVGVAVGDHLPAAAGAAVSGVGRSMAGSTASGQMPAVTSAAVTRCSGDGFALRRVARRARSLGGPPPRHPAHQRTSERGL
jgi:hypothetical protein